MASQSETVKKQQSVVRPSEQPPNVISKMKKFQNANPRIPRQHACTRCGKTPPHNRQECPAREVTCYKCSKRGHFSSVCRSTGSVRAVEYSEDAQDDSDNFLGVVELKCLPAKVIPWTVPLMINGTVVKFKIDTEADVTGIPETIFMQIKNTTLQPSCRALKGPCQNSLKVIGQFQGTITYQTKTIQQDIYVLKDLHQALIGLPAIEALDLVTRVNSIRTLPDQVIARYPTLFQGLGSMPGEYIIRVTEDAKPYAISTPRRVALPLLPKVKAELNRMEQAGVISRVDVPTKWCTGMAVVPKTDGTIRISGLDKIKFKCATRMPSNSICGSYPCTTWRRYNFFQARCQFGVLANSPQQRLHTSYHIY